jgi:hypothetical protein
MSVIVIGVYPQIYEYIFKNIIPADDFAQDCLCEALIFEGITTSGNKPYMSSGIGAKQSLTILENLVEDRNPLVGLFIAI